MFKSSAAKIPPTWYHISLYNIPMLDRRLDHKLDGTDRNAAENPDAG